MNENELVARVRSLFSDRIGDDAADRRALRQLGDLA